MLRGDLLSLARFWWRSRSPEVGGSVTQARCQWVFSVIAPFVPRVEALVCREVLVNDWMLMHYVGTGERQCADRSGTWGHGAVTW